MKAIITVTGRDTVGIIAKVSSSCSDYNANILDITQKVLGDMFVMIMMMLVLMVYMRQSFQLSL